MKKVNCKYFFSLQDSSVSAHNHISSYIPYQTGSLFYRISCPNLQIEYLDHTKLRKRFGRNTLREEPRHIS